MEHLIDYNGLQIKLIIDETRGYYSVRYFEVYAYGEDITRRISDRLIAKIDAAADEYCSEMNKTN